MTTSPTLKLYVTGRTPRSEQAIANIEQICQETLGGKCNISIIDVLEQPELAEEERILATPTLVKESPYPTRRVIGDLSDIEKVIWALGLPLPTSHPQKERTS
jgi:circadian clock protein KaiB